MPKADPQRKNPRHDTIDALTPDQLRDLAKEAVDLIGRCGAYGWVTSLDRDRARHEAESWHVMAVALLKKWGVML